jgi:hypothetical protein
VSGKKKSFSCDGKRKLSLTIAYAGDSRSSEHNELQSIVRDKTVDAVMSSLLRSLWTSVIEYETPRLVKIHNRKVGLVRRLIQLCIILYVGLYALWLQKGYQEFGRVESSVTTKIKGITKSYLDPDSQYDPGKYTAECTAAAEVAFKRLVRPSANG